MTEVFKKHIRLLIAGCAVALAVIVLSAVTFRHSREPAHGGRISSGEGSAPGDSDFLLQTSQRDFLEAENARIKQEALRIREKIRLELEKRKREDNVYIRTSIKKPSSEVTTDTGEALSIDELLIAPETAPDQVRKPDGPGFDVILDRNVKIRMVVLPGGSFYMGSLGHEWDERYVHLIMLDGFCMSATEITQRQFEAVMGYNVAYFRGEPDLPVEQLNWYEAAYYCNRLSHETGRDRCYDEEKWTCDFSKNGFRLPTEAEWEYACRAGTSTPFYTGDDDVTLLAAAWFNDNSGKRTHPVGKKEPNSWGLYDMHGNVWEWCNDWYDENYYKDSPGSNPLGPEKGTFMVIRGGAWNYFSYPARASHRGFLKPTFRYNHTGFRVVCAD